MMTETQTKELVLKQFANRVRINKKTNVSYMFIALRRTNKELDKDTFYQIFKDFQDKGLGTLVRGRGGNPDRFLWNYNLREVAENIQKGGKTSPEKKTRGKKKAESPQIETKPEESVVNLRLVLDKNNLQDVEALLQLIKDMSKS